MRELAPRLLARGPLDGLNPTAIDGVAIYRRNKSAPPANAVYERSIFLVAQGRKEARVGDEAFVYDPDNYLVVSVPLPVLSHIVDARPDRPFLSLAIDFELEDVRDIMLRRGPQTSPRPSLPSADWPRAR